MNRKTHSRRQFIKVAGMGAAVAPLSTFLLHDSALAQDATPLTEDDPQAKALGYVDESATADQDCNNCQLYQGDGTAESGPCTIFPGKSVKGKGWCKSWVAKAS